MPLNRQILNYAQYLHPEKRNAHDATNAISNLTISVASVEKERFSSVFDVSNSTTVHELYDKIRDQWLRYQYEDLKEEWYKKDERDNINEPTTSKNLHRFSYWQDALERSGLPQANEYESFQSSYKRIDHYWLKIGQLLDENGARKYTQLTNLALTVCPLSHGNAAPERELLKQVKGARSKYMAFLEEKKILEQREKQKVQEKEDVLRIEAEKQSSEFLLNDDIERCEIGLKTAEEIIEQENAKLQDALRSKTVDKNALLSAQTKISIGFDRKRECDKELAALKPKQMKLLK